MCVTIVLISRDCVAVEGIESVFATGAWLNDAEIAKIEC